LKLRLKERGKGGERTKTLSADWPGVAVQLGKGEGADHWKDEGEKKL